MVNQIQLAVIFLILALIFFMTGLRGVSGFTMNTAKWLVMIFIAVAIILLVI
jgi:uncharacterized membrane protein YtjA (UPF0391 family)